MASMRAGIYVAAEVGIISRDHTRTLVLTAGGTDSVGSQSVAWVNAETEAAPQATPEAAVVEAHVHKRRKQKTMR